MRELPIGRPSSILLLKIYLNELLIILIKIVFQAFNLFEVCLALREFRKHRVQLLPLERKAIMFNSFHDWFAQPFAAWMDIVAHQVG